MKIINREILTRMIREALLSELDDPDHLRPVEGDMDYEKIQELDQIWTRLEQLSQEMPEYQEEFGKVMIALSSLLEMLNYPDQL